MDLVAVDTCRERIYSFLSITWGIIADVDIESEKYRSLGNARFTVGAVSRILGKLLFNFLPPFYLIGQPSLHNEVPYYKYLGSDHLIYNPFSISCKKNNIP